MEIVPSDGFAGGWGQGRVVQGRRLVEKNESGNSTQVNCVMTQKNGAGSIPGDVWAIVPAAGQSLRMDGDLPKQHMNLCGKSILQHTLSRLCKMSFVKGVVVGLSTPDPWWEENPFVHPKLRGIYSGGEQRQDTVLTGIRYLMRQHAAEPSSLVMVHDAARPCITHEDVSRVVAQARLHNHGAVLGSRVKDTIKSSTEDGAISGTLDRNCCWRAYTPQVFEINDLLGALEEVQSKGVTVTDEAMAMEFAGRAPKMVQGSDMNIKITEKADLRLAEMFLEGEGES